MALAAAPGCGGSAAVDGAATTPLPHDVTVTVDLTTTHQTMVGFGAAVAYYDGSAMMNPMSAQVFQTIFADLGLEVLRVGNWYQNNNDDNAAFNQTAAFVQAVRQMGYAPVILMTSWNPPLTLKSNASLRSGGTLPKTSTGGYDYADFGAWWAASLTAFSTATGGIVPDYISIQNEPDFTTTNEGTCLFDPTEDATNAGYGQALDAVKTAIAATSGLTMPKFIGPENDSLSKNELERYVTGIAQAGYLDDLDAIAHHLYGSGTDQIPNSYSNNLSGVAAAAATAGKPIWQSEYAPNSQSFFNTGWLIQNSVTIEGVSTYLYWDLYWVPQSTPSGLVTVSTTGFTINDDYYALQHFAKGIGVGWTRVGATSTESPVTVSAFLSPDGTRLTLVVINTDGSDHQVAIDQGTFTGRTSTVFRSSGMTERYAEVGSLDGMASFDMPPQSMATVTLIP
jgi:O-glycosyl hydrolase